MCTDTNSTFPVLMFHIKSFPAVQIPWYIQLLVGLTLLVKGPFWSLLVNEQKLCLHSLYFLPHKHLQSWNFEVFHIIVLFTTMFTILQSSFSLSAVFPGTLLPPIYHRKPLAGLCFAGDANTQKSCSKPAQGTFNFYCAHKNSRVDVIGINW